MDSIALAWFSSYLAGRKQQVRCGSKTSTIIDVICGVPQGSVLGPILFIIYTADLAPIVADYGLSFHQYADDSQIYGSCLLLPSRVYQLTFLKQLIAYPAGCDPIVYSLTLRKQR